MKIRASGKFSENDQELITRAEIVSRAELVSRSLKDVSRQLRRPVHFWASILEEPAAKLRSSFSAWVFAAFIIVVVIPVAISGIYLIFLASDQFASEARFAVRGSERGPLDTLSTVAGATTSTRLQDSQIVASYIHSQGMVEELEKILNLRRIYSRPEADFIFRFNPKNSIERLVNYWWWQVDVSIDNMSGIITVVVRAFTPQDALAIAKAVITASEKLVNELSERARDDALRQARSELQRAENILQEKLRAMRELRNREGILDVSKTSEAMTKLVGDLRLELARLESEWNTQKQSVMVNTPQMQVLAARIRSMRDQINLIESQMTSTYDISGTSEAPNRVLADSIGRFERMKLEQEFAQRQYVEAAAAFERARIDVESQQIYLATFSRPVLAQEALYPKRGWIIAAIAAICLVLWGGGAGIAILVRNHAA